jgi:hypothetical protein
MAEENTYIPGTCNIGKQEMIKRRNGGIVAGIMAVIIAIALWVTHANHLYRLIVVLPLISFGIGMQQWYYKFCVGFGMKGLFNFGELGTTNTVEEKEMHKADRSKAIKMIVTGIIFAVAVTLAFYFI